MSGRESSNTVAFINSTQRKEKEREGREEKKGKTKQGKEKKKRKLHSKSSGAQ